MPEINAADKEALTAALVVLQRKGVPSDTLEMLTHGDGRGTIAPGALNEAIRAALRAPSHIGLADEEVVLAMILRPFMECCEQFCPCATPHKGCQCMNAAVAISTHLHAQRKASDVSDGDLGVPGPTSGPAVPGQSRRIPRAPLQTCAAGSVPEGWKLVPVEATDEMVRAARAAHEGAPYLPMTLYQSMIAASPSPPVIESGWQDISTAPKDGREVLLRRDGMVIAAFYGRGELSANAGASKRHPWVVLDHTNGLNHVREDWASHWMPLPSPPVIESGECGLTYQHYRTPDEVARRWKHALDLHREHVEHLFSEYEKGTISLGEVKHRAMMLISPISDQDLRLATDEAVGIAEELHRESQTVGGEVFHADGTEPDVVEKVTRTE
jgi:hypothetical protein